MDRDKVLIVLTAAASAWSWWPGIMQPNLDLPFWWTPLILVAVGTGLSTILSDGGGLPFVGAALVGTVVGASCGFLIWWPIDRIDASFVPVIVVSAALASLAVSLVSRLVLRGTTLSNDKLRRFAWLAITCCAAFGPAIVMLTPSLVAQRMTRNDRLAKERIVSLSNAAAQTMAEQGGPGRICDGEALAQHYSGPAFGKKDWQYIAGNYVKRDGYVFSVYCHEKNGYAIDARPDRKRGDGTRKFCADESGAVGCGMVWTGSRHECTPCASTAAARIP